MISIVVFAFIAFVACALLIEDDSNRQPTHVETRIPVTKPVLEPDRPDLLQEP